MAGRLRRLTAKEVEDLLTRHGFEFVSQRGSHRKWWKRSNSVQVVVPIHSGKPLPIGTLRHILSQSGIPDREWRE